MIRECAQFVVVGYTEMSGCRHTNDGTGNDQIPIDGYLFSLVKPVDGTVFPIITYVSAVPEKNHKRGLYICKNEIENKLKDGAYFQIYKEVLPS